MILVYRTLLIGEETTPSQVFLSNFRLNGIIAGTVVIWARRSQLRGRGHVIFALALLPFEK